MDRERGTFLLEEDFPEVVELDPNNNHDACCDEAKGPAFRPGLPPYHPKCGKGLFWYSCGFLKWNRKDPERHARLRHYQLMRLLGGTGITSIAGNEHARRCAPRKNSVCRPADFYPGYTPNIKAERMG